MQMTKRIRETHDMREVEEMHKRCESMLRCSPEDNIIFIADQPVGIQAVNKSEDLAVNVGMQQCINIIMGTSSTRWQYMHFSQANDPGASPSVTDTTLEISGFSPPFLPIDMSGLLGWREAVGMRLLFGAIRSQTGIGGDASVGNIGEIGVLTTNSAASAILLNHSKFVKNRITAVPSPDLQVNNSVAILSCVIEFCPVA